MSSANHRQCISQSASFNFLYKLKFRPPTFFLWMAAWQQQDKAQLTQNSPSWPSLNAETAPTATVRRKHGSAWEKLPVEITFTKIATHKPKERKRQPRKEQREKPDPQRKRDHRPKRTAKPAEPAEPDESLLKSWVCHQCEYYFSLENLCRDVYFRSLMDKDGYVSFSAILGFNRMNHLVMGAYYQLNPDAAQNTLKNKAGAEPDSTTPTQFDSTWACNFLLECIQSSEMLEIKNDEILSVRLFQDWDKWLLPLSMSSLIQQTSAHNATPSLPEKKDTNVGDVHGSQTTLAMHDDDLFEFDESYDAKSKMQEKQDKRGTDFDDAGLDSILLVTRRPSIQSQSQSTKPVFPPLDVVDSSGRAVTDLADMFSEGLYMYEKSNRKLHSASRKNSVSSSYDPNSRSAQRFFPVTSEASPPVGWFMQNSLGHPSSHLSAGSQGLARSYKELQPFQHPSYELLKENGFIQHKYSKYHDKAIKGLLNSHRSPISRRWQINRNEYLVPLLVAFPTRPVFAQNV